MARKSRRASATPDSTTGSRYIVNHAFNFTDADGVDHWITTATAHKIEALLPKDMIADKVASGMISDSTDTAGDGEATE